MSSAQTREIFESVERAIANSEQQHISNNQTQSSSQATTNPNESHLEIAPNTSTNVVQDISNPCPDQSQPTSPHNSTTSILRVPGTYPPEWLADNETDSCMSCSGQFTIIKRRHHCRSCGKIFCGDCCRLKAKLLYLDNKEARVCNDCFKLLEYTLLNSEVTSNRTPVPASSAEVDTQQARPANRRVQSVLKSRTSNECNTSSSSSSDHQLNKQVIFSDGIRPGTDLSESFPYPVPSSSSSSTSASFSLLSRQPKEVDSLRKSKSKSHNLNKNITVCDEIGYLPPIVINKGSPIANSNESASASNNSLTNLIVSQFKSVAEKKSIQATMESRSCPLNGVIKFEEISCLVGVNEVVTFLLLKDFFLKVKLIKKTCCMDKISSKESVIPQGDLGAVESETIDQILTSSQEADNSPEYWCFTSDGLARFGQSEIILVLDRPRDDPCIPRDVFKIYLTLHELALRRQSLDNLGNLLFQDGLFGNKDTVGLLFVRATDDHCLENLVLPDKTFLIALVLQRWEVPWSKVFPVRLLLRLGHRFGVYPYPIVSLRSREPVYYEVGHTIISILGDFRNYRYSITHVDGMKVMINKSTKKVSIQLHQSSYQQFNKVLDSSNNEHVLAWSCCPFKEADGHLVSVQNEDGQYETVEFFKESSHRDSSTEIINSNLILGASFIIFSGALKVNQTGQSAKISIVEDGLLIQIQSCKMSALRNAIHFMHHFEIDCGKLLKHDASNFSLAKIEKLTSDLPIHLGNNQDPLNSVEIDWQLETT